MPTITVKYTDQTLVTLPGTSLTIYAVAGAEYRHADKSIDAIAFALSTSNQATLNVVATGGPMPAQTCFSGAAPTFPLPFIAEFTPSSSGPGVLRLTIPASSTATYPARLEVTGGGNVDITVKH